MENKITKIKTTMTTKQRHRIYKKALMLLNKQKKTYPECPLSLCMAIRDAIRQSDCLLFLFIIPEELVEFHLFKPRKAAIKRHRGYWLKEDDLQTRQIILDFCIEMTK